MRPMLLSDETKAERRRVSNARRQSKIEARQKRQSLREQAAVAAGVAAPLPDVVVYCGGRRVPILVRQGSQTHRLLSLCAKHPRPHREKEVMNILPVQEAVDGLTDLAASDPGACHILGTMRFNLTMPLEEQRWFGVKIAMPSDAEKCVIAI